MKNSNEKINIYDEIEIEDLDYNHLTQIFYYPCPCGDKFMITLDQIKNNENLAKCPSCSLIIKIIYDELSYTNYIS